MAQEPIGLTLNIRDDEAPVPVYQDSAGLDTFASDVPYLLGDGHSLLAPVPVVVSAGPVWKDALGNPFDAIPVSAVPGGGSLVEGPLDLIEDRRNLASIGGTFDLASGSMTLAVVTRYAGTFGTITATHGGEPLTLARVDAANGIATAVFYGNGLTTESAALVVSVSGATLGPAILRMRDDWGLASIATDWADGKTSSATGSGYVTTSTAEPRRVLFARGSKSINGINTIGATAGASVQYGLRGLVLSGTFASPTAAAWDGAAWSNVGGEYIHGPTGGPAPLRLTVAPITNQIGAKIVYTSEWALGVRFVRPDGSLLGMSLPAGVNVTGYVHTVPDGTTFDKIYIIAQNVGTTTIHSVAAISNIVGLHASIGTSVGLAPSGWSIQGSSNPAGDQAISAFTIYDGA